MADLELFHFTRSHYNEKVRWALDFKKLPHLRHSLLPGPHAPKMMRLSGQKRVPVIRRGDEVLAGSAAILERLEELAPEPRLFPADPNERERALAIQARFDAEVGPAVRLAGFAEFLADPGYFAGLFSDDRPWPVRVAYRAVFPIVKLVIVRELRIRPEAVGPALEATLGALDFVSTQAGPGGYLVGDGFSVADLTAAALLMPAVQPAQGPTYPDPAPVVQRDWVARWSSHPGAAWVREIYARHRGESSEIAA